MASGRNLASRLGIFLGTLRVGTLYRASTDKIVFDFDEAYIAAGPSRPILSCSWLYVGDEEQTIARMRDTKGRESHGGLLPNWFAGLLPEGALYEIVTKEFGPGRYDDFDVIARLGEDLPGAVIVRPEGGPPMEPEKKKTLVRFSLAGVQLKLSMRQAKDKVTLPASGETGDIIAKLPSEKWRGLPEAEFTTMKLAESAGVDVADCELLPMSRLEGVPSEWISVGSHFLAVTRFDRRDGQRIHAEDFAQVIGAGESRKYSMSNEETNMRLADRFTAVPVPQVLEAARRIVANILLANNDCHLKNWSFVYEDPLRPKLSPAYDIVPASYFVKDNRMALELQKTRNPFKASLSTFERVAAYVNVPSKVLVREVKETVERAAEKWPRLLQELPVEDDLVTMLRDRWSRLALTAGVPNPFEPPAPAPRGSGMSP